MNTAIADLNITRPKEGIIVLKGEIKRDNILDLVETLADNPIPYNSELLIDVSQLDIESGITLLTLVNTLRALSRRVSALTVSGAPKQLYNSLYSTGLLGGPSAIRLENRRDEMLVPA
ncbi:MAG: hypothetical protein OEZ43_18630 [Gammaproteobacteria bacterium]|nr:hypothetical protein [Gammaproteobacteria bacterium]